MAARYELRSGPAGHERTVLAALAPATQSNAYSSPVKKTSATNQPQTTTTEKAAEAMQISDVCTAASLATGTPADAARARHCALAASRSDATVHDALMNDKRPSVGPVRRSTRYARSGRYSPIYTSQPRRRQRAARPSAADKQSHKQYSLQIQISSRSLSAQPEANQSASETHECSVLDLKSSADATGSSLTIASPSIHPLSQPPASKTPSKTHNDDLYPNILERFKALSTRTPATGNRIANLRPTADRSQRSGLSLSQSMPINTLSPSKPTSHDPSAQLTHLNPQQTKNDQNNHPSAPSMAGISHSCESRAATPTLGRSSSFNHVPLLGPDPNSAYNSQQGSPIVNRKESLMQHRIHKESDLESDNEYSEGENDHNQDDDPPDEIDNVSREDSAASTVVDAHEDVSGRATAITTATFVTTATIATGSSIRRRASVSPRSPILKRQRMVSNSSHDSQPPSPSAARSSDLLRQSTASSEQPSMNSASRPMPSMRECLYDTESVFIVPSNLTNSPAKPSHHKQGRRISPSGLDLTQQEVQLQRQQPGDDADDEQEQDQDDDELDKKQPSGSKCLTDLMESAPDPQNYTFAIPPLPSRMQEASRSDAISSSAYANINGFVIWVDPELETQQSSSHDDHNDDAEYSASVQDSMLVDEYDYSLDEDKENVPPNNIFITHAVGEHAERLIRLPHNHDNGTHRRTTGTDPGSRFNNHRDRGSYGSASRIDPHRRNTLPNGELSLPVPSRDRKVFGDLGIESRPECNGFVDYYVEYDDTPTPSMPSRINRYPNSAASGSGMDGILMVGGDSSAGGLSRITSASRSRPVAYPMSTHLTSSRTLMRYDVEPSSPTARRGRDDALLSDAELVPGPRFSNNGSNLLASHRSSMSRASSVSSGNLLHRFQEVGTSDLRTPVEALDGPSSPTPSSNLRLGGPMHRTVTAIIQTDRNIAQPSIERPTSLGASPASAVPQHCPATMNPPSSSLYCQTSNLIEIDSAVDNQVTFTSEAAPLIVPVPVPASSITLSSSRLMSGMSSTTPPPLNPSNPFFSSSSQTQRPLSTRSRTQNHNERLSALSSLTDIQHRALVVQETPLKSVSRVGPGLMTSESPAGLLNYRSEGNDEDQADQSLCMSEVSVATAALSFNSNSSSCLNNDLFLVSSHAHDSADPVKESDGSDDDNASALPPRRTNPSRQARQQRPKIFTIPATKTSHAPTKRLHGSRHPSRPSELQAVPSIDELDPTKTDSSMPSSSSSSETDAAQPIKSRALRHPPTSSTDDPVNTNTRRLRSSRLASTVKS